MQVSGAPGPARVKQVKRQLVDIAKVQVVDELARVVGKLCETLELADLGLVDGVVVVDADGPIGIELLDLSCYFFDKLVIALLTSVQREPDDTFIVFASECIVQPAIEVVIFQID